MCGPVQHIWPDRCANQPLTGLVLDCTNVVVGGGQIFGQLNQLVGSIKKITHSAKVIGWGVGLPPRGTRDGVVMDVVSSFAVFGTRNYDWKDQLTFMPCGSCLSSAFNNVAPARHEVVAYLHRKKPGPSYLPSSIPTMSNRACPPSAVIDFIASGDTVITSSYHGVYWAQLLGRKVICIPYNDKFETFQHAPTKAVPDNWLGAVASARRTAPLLEEYRALNRQFADKAMEIWNG